MSMIIGGADGPTAIFIAVKINPLFQILAILVLVVFYGCYLGKMMLQKRAGIRTDQMGKGKVGLPKWVEIIMKIATYATVVVEVLSICFSESSLPDILRLFGFGIAVIGDIFFILAVVTMKDSWRAGVSHTDKTELVTKGIFQISRNPAFLGFDLVYLGILLMFFNGVLFLFSLFAALMLHLQIVNNEEPFMLETFGEEYIEYCRHVLRYLGRR